MSMGVGPTLHSVQSWKERLRAALDATAHRSVVFVLGDGVARDARGGSWSVKRVVEALDQDYGIRAPIASEDVSEADVYGKRLELLKGKRGQAEVARLFRRVVLAGCKLPESDPRRRAALEPPDHRRWCEQLMLNPGDWHVPAGLEALAEIIGDIQARRQQPSSRSKAPLVVTTNFDPLVELALRHKGIASSSYSIVNDSGPSHSGESVGVWHVHGTWTDVTLHTPQALQADRQKLRDALKRRFDGADVFVIGYGGWNDVVFSTLADIVANDKFDEPPEILWAFYEGDEKAVLERYAHVVAEFDGALEACQVSFYTGIDAHGALPDVASLLRVGAAVVPGGEAPKLPPVWMVPFSPNPHFRGRTVELDELRYAWASTPRGQPPRPQVLNGLGGVGKTQLAAEYAWKEREKYDAVLWVEACTAESLRAHLAALVEPLGLREREANEQAVRLTAVQCWLRDNHRWLLVVDNVDIEEAKAAVLSALSKTAMGHVLITSRLTSWPSPIQLRRLGTLPEDEATEFLLERGRELSPLAEDARRVARELGGLPLALEQAAAYLLERRVSFARYLERLQRTRKKLFEHPTRGATELEAERAAVATTWIATEEALGAGARALLRLVSFFAPEEIPRALFEKAGGVLLAGVNLLGEEPESAGGERDEGGDGDESEASERNLVELEKYSLITLRPETFSCHRLVMAVQQLRVSPEERAPWLRLALEVFESSTPGDPSDVRNWPAWDAIRPHLARVVDAADEANITHPTSRWMSQLGLLYRTRALWAEAEPLMRRALAIHQETYGLENPDVAIRLSNLASLLQDTNRLSEAEPLMRMALAIHEETYGLEHPSVGIRLNNLAQLLQDTNRLSEAEPLMRRALAIHEETSGLEHPVVAIRLSNLASLLQDTNRPSEAEPLMRRALAIGEKSYGPEHPDVATVLNNLASLLKNTNRPSEAEPLMRRALAIDEKSYGPEHPDVARDLNNLALLLNDTNRLFEAEPLMRRALAIFEKSYGPEHPSVARSVSNLASLLQDTNRLSEAEPLMRRALAIDQKGYGPDHPNVAIDLNNLATLLQDTNRLPEAEPLVRRAVVILEKSYGLDHPTSQAVRKNLELLHAAGVDDPTAPEVGSPQKPPGSG